MFYVPCRIFHLCRAFTSCKKKIYHKFRPMLIAEGRIIEVRLQTTQYSSLICRNPPMALITKAKQVSHWKDYKMVRAWFGPLVGPFCLEPKFTWLWPRVYVQRYRVQSIYSFVNIWLSQDFILCKRAHFDVHFLFINIKHIGKYMSQRAEK